MSLLKTLLNAGILPGDAQTLDQYYGNEDPTAFLDGLEQVARTLAFKSVQIQLPPQSQPWKDIFLAVLNDPNGDPDQAFTSSLAQYDALVQMALSGAIMARVNDQLKWQQQNQAGQGKKRKWHQYIKILDSIGYQFRYNQCKYEVEVNGSPINDNLMKEIAMRARDAGVWEVHVLEDAYIAHAWNRRYHPVRDYLTSLTRRGGDPIGDLAGYFEDEHGVFGTWLRRWLVGAVARVMANEQNRVLVLDGVQGLGKSQFVQWLASPLPEYFHEGPVVPEDKDCRLRRMTTWIWEINEFGATTRKADREALKAFLTTKMVRERKPYGRYDIQGPAIANFIGTVNNESGVLSDPTGNRRFMIAHINKIDWSYTKLEVDQIWAQAFDLYLSGEPWDLQPDEKLLADEINETYQTVDIVEETIKKFFDIDPQQNTWRMATIDIMDMLKNPIQGNLKAGTEIDARRLSAVMTKLGLGMPKLIRIGQRVMRGYCGIQRRLLIP
jgi:predicted P-loop ATPase